MPSLVLIAQAVFLLEREQTDATERPTPAGGIGSSINQSIKTNLYSALRRRRIRGILESE